MTTGVGVESTHVTQWLPQFIFYVSATQLQRVKITLLGEGTIVDLDDAGLNAIGSAFRINDVTNGYVIPIADGFIPGQNVDYVFTNAAVATPVIYGFSLNRGTRPISSKTQTINADSGVTLDDFSLAAFPNSGATDEWNIQYMDNLVQKLDQPELRAQLSFDNLIKNAAADLMMRNDDRTIQQINYIPKATSAIYVQRILNPIVEG